MNVWLRLPRSMVSCGRRRGRGQNPVCRLAGRRRGIRRAVPGSAAVRCPRVAGCPVPMISAARATHADALNVVVVIPFQESGMFPNDFRQCFANVAIFASQAGLIATVHAMLAHDGWALYVGMLSCCSGVGGLIAMRRPAIPRVVRVRRDRL